MFTFGILATNRISQIAVDGREIICFFLNSFRLRRICFGYGNRINFLVVNVLLIVYKEAGPDKQCIKMFNPTPIQIESLFGMRLVGFNCRSYDGPIMYGRYIGYNNYQLWELSQDMIVRDKRNPFRDAENVFEIDVYDYSTDKKSLKKWEVELEQKGILPRISCRIRPEPPGPLHHTGGISPLHR